MGGIGGSAGQILSAFQQFAEAVVAAGAAVLNDFLNVLAGSAAEDLVIDEFSTQNTYLYTDDAYIDALHNPDRIVLNSLREWWLENDCIASHEACMIQLEKIFKAMKPKGVET